MTTFDERLATATAWAARPRFDGIVRLYAPREVAEQQGTLDNDHTVAREAAEAFYDRLRALFAERRSITTFGPYSPGQAVTMKRLGIEGIYLGGWATSAKGSVTEDPGADLASYPLSQVPDEAATIVRALLTADRNQAYLRSRMTEAQRQATPVTDFRPFLIADADTGHGGDAHVRNLVRRFVEVGVPGYHIEDQRPGAKKCGHQGGKVLVACDEQIKRLNAARFQLDVMSVAGILVARTDAEAASLLDTNADERDQPFVLGATRTDVPRYKVATLAMLQAFHRAGVEEVRGHQLYALAAPELAEADAWLQRTGIADLVTETAAAWKAGRVGSVDAAVDKVGSKLVDVWQAEAGLKTFPEAVADLMALRESEGEVFELTRAEWLAFALRSSHATARERAETMSVSPVWDAEIARTPEGYYQVQGGIDYAIAKSLAVAPFCDILWMETKTADLHDAEIFARAIHAEFPGKMLAYNLSPSFNWDTTGMTDEQMRAFPEELGKRGFVFNFITYGGHQIDGLAGEEFSTALLQDGMLALARLQRKLRLVESPYKTPQTLVGGPRLDAALAASSGRTATTKAMGKGSTQFQHLVQTEVPPKLLEEWLALWASHHGLTDKFRVSLRPHTAGSDLLELSIRGRGEDKVANVVFANIQDRRGRHLLSVRDQNTFDLSLRRKRLMTLMHLFLIHRYKTFSVHYVSPTDDNQHQTQHMMRHGIYDEVASEVGQIIVANVNAPRVAEYLAADRAELGRLIGL